jgi:glycosyltransferase involved in cell wall biosynthesis
MVVSRSEIIPGNPGSCIDFDLHSRTISAATEGLASTLAPDSPTRLSQPNVAVLLCTFQGGRFLAEQLESIGAQRHSNLTVWASDDGSDDGTLRILDQYQTQWGKEHLSIRSGPRQGFAANFLSLVCDQDIQADFFAFVDQDDIWECDKISSALSKLNCIPKDVPALYCARTRMIDENGRDIGFSPLFEKKPSFANALVQNIGSGNTMVMNNAARQLLSSRCERDVVYHDWWLYLLVSGAGGTVFYDAYPTTRYRQHSSNLMGPNAGWRARLLRIWLLFNGQFRNWNTVNTRALQKAKHQLTPENQRILDQFCEARDRWLVPRLWGLKRSGIYRQTLGGNIGLITAAVLKKV